MATDKINNLEKSDLGAIDDVTDDDLTEFKKACERVLPAFHGDEAAAIAYIWIAYIWNDGNRCWDNIIDGPSTPAISLVNKRQKTGDNG